MVCLLFPLWKGIITINQSRSNKTKNQKQGEKAEEIKMSYGRKDGSQAGRSSGGRGRNRTDNCRHPDKKKERKK